MFLRTRTRRRIRSRLLCALLAGCALLWSPVPGMALACVAWDSWGLARDCTFTEVIGKCMWEAANSRDECLASSSGGFWGWSRCHIAYGLDNTACIIGSPIAHILGKFQ